MFSHAQSLVRSLAMRTAKEENRLEDMLLSIVREKIPEQIIQRAAIRVQEAVVVSARADLEREARQLKTFELSQVVDALIGAIPPPSTEG